MILALAALAALIVAAWYVRRNWRALKASMRDYGRV
jgi:hypothetical protein